MTVFLSLFFNLLPLYGLIGLGYFAGRYLHVDRQSLGNLAIFIFMPVVTFGFVSDIDFKPAYLVLPVLLFLILTIVTFTFLKIGEIVYGDKKANLLALCAGSGNVGYFGLPLALLFFENDVIAVYMFMILGGLVYEATIFYYLAARGAFDVRQSLIKLIKFPSLYAMIAGLSVNAMHIELPELFWTYWAYFKGCYVVVGMMIIGAALSRLEHFVFGGRFVSLVIAGKFILWPLLAYGSVLMDLHFLHWFGTDIHHLIMIMAIVPPAANTVAFAAQLNLEPEKAATTILLSTVFALFYIPLIIWLLGI